MQGFRRNGSSVFTLIAYTRSVPSPFPQKLEIGVERTSGTRLKNSSILQPFTYRGQVSGVQHSPCRNTPKPEATMLP